MLEKVLLVSIVNLLAAMSPGPDFAIVFTNALRGGRGAGFLTALGIACALTIHVSYCSLGLSNVLTKIPAIMSLCTLLASGYLGYLGWSILKSHYAIHSAQIHEVAPDHDQQKKHASFTQGLLTCLLNPKAILFIVAIYSTLIRPDTISTGFFYGIFLVAPALIWFMLLSQFLTAKRTRNFVLKLQTKVLLGMGWVLIGLGMLVLGEMIWHLLHS